MTDDTRARALRVIQHTRSVRWLADHAPFIGATEAGQDILAAIEAAGLAVVDAGELARLRAALAVTVRRESARLYEEEDD